MPTPQAPFNYAETNLKGVDFKEAYLSNTNLKRANVIFEDLKLGYLLRTIIPIGEVHP